MNLPVLHSIQIGPVRSFHASESSARIRGPWTTGIYKHTVTDPIWLSTLGLDGDQHHFHDHGGPDKALLAYAAEHYPAWAAELGLSTRPLLSTGWRETLQSTTKR